MLKSLEKQKSTLWLRVRSVFKCCIRNVVVFNLIVNKLTSTKVPHVSINCLESNAGGFTHLDPFEMQNIRSKNFQNFKTNLYL
jgi:hypothetical protein